MEPGSPAIQFGSSPLARGTQIRPDSAALIPRFIPAGAGNTTLDGVQDRTRAVHPRWRGEHFRLAGSSADADGSSPLARGTLSTAMVKVTAERFIPAGAGNTKNISHSIRSTTVHPRWRGEHGSSFFPYRRRYGSSPLARGTRAMPGDCWLTCRFIPAGAGNTRTHAGVLPSSAVHPRWRGEHPLQRAVNWRRHGSSPLARGTLAQTHHHQTRQRFIPAGAGNTSAQAHRKR